MITGTIIITTIVWVIGVTRIGDNETVAHVRATLATITEGEGSRGRKGGREGMNERVIDRIVIRRTILNEPGSPDARGGAVTPRGGLVSRE